MEDKPKPSPTNSPQSLSEIYAEINKWLDIGWVGPFPYKDCRALLQMIPNGQDLYEGLIPSLDDYFYEVYSSGSGLKILLTFDESRVEKRYRQLQSDFWTTFPEFRALESYLFLFDDLHTWMTACDKVRILVVEAINIARGIGLEKEAF